MPFIQNVSMDAIIRGNHKDAGPKGILIQIVDPGYEFPEPSFDFDQIHQFEFLDTEGCDVFSKFQITEDQASNIAEILQYAKTHSCNVIVHCHAGVCRSGAVAEVGVMMGFNSTSARRQPNVLVKQKLLHSLGMQLDSTTSAFADQP